MSSLKHFVQQQPEMLIAFLLIGLVSYVALDHVEMHVAVVIFDDQPITYANLVKWPERFENDVVSIYGIGSTYGTILNWGSGVLWRYLNIPSDVSYVFLAYAQSVLLGFGAYALTRQLTDNRWLPVIAVIFIYAAHPWHWNLANYSNIYPLVYAGQVALPVNIIALLFALNKRKTLALITLIIAGLIHPSVTLYTGGMIGLYWLWQNWGTRAFITDSIKLIVVIGIIITPGLFASSLAQGSIPQSKLITNFKGNGHFNPTLFPDHYNLAARSVIDWVLLVGLSLCCWRSFHRDALKLISAVFVGAILLFVSQQIALRLEINQLIQIAGGRAFQVFNYLAVPLVLYYWWDHLKEFDWLSASLIGTALVATVNKDLVPYRELLLAFILLDISKGRLTFFRFKINSTAQDILRGAVVLVIVHEAPRLVLDREIGPINAYNFAIILGILGIILIIWQGINRLFDNTSLTTRLSVGHTILLIIVVVFGIATLAWLDRVNNPYNSIINQDLLVAQRWARDNTPEDAMFVGTETAWRGGSQRAYLLLQPYAWYVYFLDERLVGFENQMYRWRHTSPLGEVRYEVLSNQEMLNLRDTFQIDYALWRVGLEPLSFKSVYANSHFILYDLHEPISEPLDAIDRLVQSEWSGGVMPQNGYILDLNLAYGLNSLRPHLVLDYTPNVDENPAYGYKLYNDSLEEILAQIWSSGVAASEFAALGIQYLYIDETWWNSAPEVTKNVLQSGDFEEVFFIQQDNKLRALYNVFNRVRLEFDTAVPGTGWADPETLGSWTNSTEAIIEFELPVYDYRIEFRIASSLLPEILASMTLHINDQPISLTSHLDDVGATIFEGHISREIIENNPDKTSLVFHTDRLISPVEAGFGGDSRQLGLMFDWLEIRKLASIP